MKQIQREIGEIFRYQGALFEVVKRTDSSCDGCAFHHHLCDWDEIGSCWKEAREDVIDVMFERIDDPGDCCGTFREDKGLFPNGIKMEPFNLDEAMNGGAVCTRLGADVRIVCFDRNDDRYPIVALVGKKENVWVYTKEGKFWHNGSDNVADLMMKSATERDTTDEDAETCDDIHPEVIEKAINISLYGEPKTKPFNLEAARAGNPVCTKNYADARIVCFDVNDGKNILALVKHNGKEVACIYGLDGKFIHGTRDCEDLVMMATHKAFWQNVFKNGDTYYTAGYLYKTEEEAITHMLVGVHDWSHTYVSTVQVEWDE